MIVIIMIVIMVMMSLAFIRNNHLAVLLSLIAGHFHPGMLAGQQPLRSGFPHAHAASYITAAHQTLGTKQMRVLIAGAAGYSGSFCRAQGGGSIGGTTNFLLWT